MKPRFKVDWEKGTTTEATDGEYMELNIEYLVKMQQYLLGMSIVPTIVSIERSGRETDPISNGFDQLPQSDTLVEPFAGQLFGSIPVVSDPDIPDGFLVLKFSDGTMKLRIPDGTLWDITVEVLLILKMRGEQCK
jgi:hypothetical protein